MTTAVADYTEFKDKQVRLVYNPPEGGDAVEYQGTVNAVLPDGSQLLLKPKGKTQLVMLSTDNIEPGTLHLNEDTEKKAKPSKVKPVELGRAKSHLLERHGITLDEADGMTEEQAFEYHQGLNHEELRLGHVHVAKEAPAENASE